MAEQVYLVTDLGPGDGGKGGVVHKVCDLVKPEFVVKVGGGQGSHGVKTSAGESFAFSQWGCGTFQGIKTHLSKRFVCIPEGLLQEGDILRYQHGVHNAFDLLTVDSEALCATHYHGIASRLKEMARGNNPRGTIGTGTGEAYRDLFRLPDLAIRAGDLCKPCVRDKLAAVREQQLQDLGPIINGEFLPEDREEVQQEIALLQSDKFLEFVAGRFSECAKQVKIVNSDFLKQEILAKESAVVVESSHGVLTDHFYGFFPHVSAIRTLPKFTEAMLRDAGYSGRILNVGVTRAYSIRHGAGPMPTEDPAIAQRLLPGSHKCDNRYQGKVRVGPLDLVLLKYAIEVCGGPSKFDALAVTWFDQVQTNGVWHLCRHYRPFTKNPKFFSLQGEINVRRGEGTDQLKYQELLGRELKKCRPVIMRCAVQSTERDKLFLLCADTLQCELGVPVRMVGFGPTELDKVCV
jgi:adenylosuccinate synthase